ncbi:hypothetical protein N0V93_009021 [Gnomoniopsis smithogilvyi]|uniref:Carboxylic ester hydrolase n=1 Tax=Gnomoniopsis smithogilvyi TaxID=1191159 RepID=A0A9W9CTE0_9PEZI|nr:hypothetical protein N0V93_009021 [Gnomoniopsis smithogilvyi]
MILVLLLSVGAVLAANSQNNDRRQTPATSCATLKAPTIPNATVVSIQAAERRNFTAPSGGMGAFGAAPLPPLNFCDVNVTLTHGTANDSVRVEVWMPLTGWNGRFQGTGGGGFIPGTFGSTLAPQVAAGFSAASTDAGLHPASFDGSGIVFNDQLMTNFAFLSVHEMALVGKAVSQQFYGTAPKFSYWNGCSTGGRQGYMEAQSFPEDFDGILAAAPAINWGKFCPAEFWPFQVQTEANEFVPACVLTGLTQANIQACDALDGGMDGLISDPSVCRFDANTIIGKTVPCNSTTVTVSANQASIYNKIISGPVDNNGTRLWFGVEPGTNFNSLAATTPFNLGSTWLDTFVGNRAQLGGQLSRNNTLSAQTYSSLFEESIASKFGKMLATDNANLTQLKSTGHKLLSWHGLADTIIMPQGTFDYRQRVETMMGGAAAVDQFYRLFVAPGVGHCGGGGPSPNTATALNVLINWVENGVAPETLPANITTRNVTVSRNLCRFPLVAHFNGTGDLNSAAGWTCIPSQGQLASPPAVPAGASATGPLMLGWVASAILVAGWLVI